MTSKEMTIRSRIILIGMVAIGSLLLMLIGRYYEVELRRYWQLRQVAADVAVTAGFSALVHELQKERGLTVGFLGAPSPVLRTDLLAQQQRTDSAMAVLARDVQPVTERLQAPLAALRKQTLNGAITHYAAHRAYSGWIQDLMDRVARLIWQSKHELLKNDLIAHLRLMSIKEYLGRVRAKTHYAILTTKAGEAWQAMLAVAGLHALFHESVRLFRQEAAPGLVAAYDRDFNGPDAETMVLIMRNAAEGIPFKPAMTADKWFALATRVIDRLRMTTEYSLARIVSINDDFLRDLRRRLVVYAFVTVLFGCLILFLVVSTVRGMLENLSHLLGEIARIRKQQDFSCAIPVRSNDEIGVIARAFNELLATVGRLFKEKDYLAGTDHLTGLANRRPLMDVLGRELARRPRYSEPLSVIMLDIDHFKRINDTYGHRVGDQVLQEMARLVAGLIRRADFPARWGGEEFVILLPDTDSKAAAGLAEKLRDRIARHGFPVVGKVTISCGVSSLRRDENYGDPLFERADQAMYAAKQGGRNRVVLLEQDDV